jgi:hypothetical protein
MKRAPVHIGVAINEALAAAKQPRLTAPATSAATASERAPDAGLIVVAIPGLRVRNPLNGSHRHWSGPARERKRVRRLVAAALLARVGRACPLPLPLDVTVRRVAPSAGLDTFENLPASLKAVVDEVAAWLGLPHDRDPRVTWRPAQRYGAWAVEITIAPRGAP